jgi:hypothetical protein
VKSPRRVTIIPGEGLGDVLVSLPAAYALRAQGHQADVVNRPRAEALVWARILPLYVPLVELPDSEQIDILHDGLNGHGPCLPWQGETPGSMVDWIAERAGAKIKGTPRVAWLRKPAPTDAREPYVLFGIEGSCHLKHLTAEQIEQAAAGQNAVAIHWAPREVPEGVENLTGQTTPEEYLALVANARAVVSCDQGTLHLAAAFGVPVVAVVSPQTIAPERFAADYKPSIWLPARKVESISPRLIADCLYLLLETEPAPVRATRTGPAWWQSAEVQSRMAAAAEHQQRIDARIAAGSI